MADNLDDTVIVRDPPPPATPPTTEELDVSEITIENVDETLRASVEEALRRSVIDVTASMGTSTEVTPSAQDQRLRDSSESRRPGGVHFEETDKGGGDKGRKTKKHDKTEMCRPPYCKGERLEYRTMLKYLSNRKIDHISEQLVVKTFLDQLRIAGHGINERVVCTLLYMPPMAVNKLLSDNGLKEWIIRESEEQTLAKLVILLQLAKGSKNF